MGVQPDTTFDVYMVDLKLLHEHFSHLYARHSSYVSSNQLVEARRQIITQLLIQICIIV